MPVSAVAMNTDGVCGRTKTRRNSCIPTKASVSRIVSPILVVVLLNVSPNGVVFES